MNKSELIYDALLALKELLQEEGIRPKSILVLVEDEVFVLEVRDASSK